MDPFGHSGEYVFIWLPRVSGDGPAAQVICDDKPTAAPRERGWTLVAGGHVVSNFGCPA